VHEQVHFGGLICSFHSDRILINAAPLSLENLAFLLQLLLDRLEVEGFFRALTLIHDQLINDFVFNLYMLKQVFDLAHV